MVNSSIVNFSNGDIMCCYTVFLFVIKASIILPSDLLPFSAVSLIKCSAFPPMFKHST